MSQKIGDFTFANCKELTSVALPISLTAIGDRAFGDCDKIASVYAPFEIPFEIFAFSSAAKQNAILYVPVGARSIYQNTKGWEFENINADGISSIQMLIESSTTDDSTWYKLDGTMMKHKPMNRGIYIKNGKKMIIK